MKRLIYRGELRFPRGLHTGDGRRLDPETDHPLWRDAEGKVALAASSLAGCLRADLRRLADELGEVCDKTPLCDCVVCRLMGPLAFDERRRSPSEQALRASKLYVWVGSASSAVETRIRDRVGIARRTRTAAAQRKYDLEVVSGLVVFPFELRVDEARADERRLLALVLERLAEGWLFLGGRSSSGLGQTWIEGLERQELDLSDVDQLIDYLLDDGPATARPHQPVSAEIGQDGVKAGLRNGSPDQLAAARDSSSAQLRLGLELEFPWGFLINDPRLAEPEKVAHVFTRLADGRPLLAGSSLRGALRSRGERILRSLAGNKAACDPNVRGASCHEHLDQLERGRNRRLGFAEELAELCPACRVFGCGRLASGIKVTDFTAVAGCWGTPKVQEFVAIDRFTGGAADQKKFNAEACYGVTFSGELFAELGRHRLDPWGLGLLVLVLRDLLYDDLVLGWGSAKGLNEYRARITSVRRFWIHPPTRFGLNRLAGSAQAGNAVWQASAAAQLASPAAVTGLADGVLAEVARGWVAALHAYLRESTDRGAEGGAS